MDGIGALTKLFHASSASFRRAFRFLVLGSLLALSWSCHYHEGVSTTLLAEGNVDLPRLAVLPFENKIPGEESAKSTICPICGAVFYTDGNTVAEGTVALEDLFAKRLKDYKQFTLIDSERSAGVYHRVVKSSQGLSTETLQHLGRELGADGVLVGYLFRYRERMGYWYSVKKPASVAFDVHLIRVSDGRMVWRATFDRTQSSLMENVSQLSSFLHWGAKWLTAQELSEEGVGEILDAYPGIK